MADAAARREARRKRILENSQNRLQLIAGNSEAEYLKESPVTSSSPIVPEYEIPAPQITFTFDKPTVDNGVLFSEPESIAYSSNNAYQEFIAGGDVDLLSGLSSLLPQQSSQTPTTQDATQTIWEKIVAFKYDIVLLSILIQILYCCGIPIFEDHYIFLPLIVYTTTKVLWLPSESSSSLANVLLLLNGMDSAKIKKIMFITKIFGAFSQDVFVFIFTTVSLQATYLFLFNALVT